LSSFSIKQLIPDYIETCGNLDQFWQYIKSKYDNYAERRQFIWSSFNKLLSFIEGSDKSPSDSVVTSRITKFDINNHGLYTYRFYFAAFLVVVGMFITSIFFRRFLKCVN
jgi:hypothetical protein